MPVAAVIRIRFDRSVVPRMLAAGTAWGLALSAGFTVMIFATCDTICLDGIAAMTATNIAAGIVTIGPLAAFTPSGNE